jgi:ribonucleoside-triphosphate reductase
MNRELRRTPVTFPVVTACFSVDDDNNIRDEQFLKMIAEKNLEFGFINLYAGKTSTLSSCCRLRSETDNEYFNSFGSGSSKIGSLGVVSINFPRLATKYKDNHEQFFKQLSCMVGVCAKIINSKRKIVKKRIDNGNHPLYKLGFAELERQYSTVGVNGFNECIEIFGKDITTDDGVALGLQIIDVINRENKKYQSHYKSPHNCEQVPGENMSIKMAQKDSLLGYNTKKYDLYSNQFIPLITKADLLDRIRLQGIFDKHFSGGAICHLNVEERISDSKLVEDLIKTSVKMGVIYFAINYNLQRCVNGHMSVGRGEKCQVCGDVITDNFTRVVGFLTSVKNWHKVRREQDYPNRTFYNGELK